jgi:FecR-like protein/tetratricopeptide repeat protein
MSRLVDHLKLDLSHERSARLWRGVSGRLYRERRSPAIWAVATLAAALAFAGGWLAAARGPVNGWSALVTSSDSTTLELSEGSRLRLARDSRLELHDNVRDRVALRLEKGRVECDVAPRPERKFSVTAAGFDVVAHGTRFSVDVGDGRGALSVTVEEGKVVVQHVASGRERAQLSAGQRWSAESASEVTSATPRAPTTAASDAGASEASARPQRAPRFTSATRDQQARAARLLLDRGNVSRREGNVAGAARAYEELLARYPSDPRAGLAAFELGRLRMDRLNDLPGAIRALERAGQLLADAGLREDAMARLVTALDATHEAERCLTARAAYLESYPTGIHVRPVAGACGVSR